MAKEGMRKETEKAIRGLPDVWVRNRPTAAAAPAEATSLVMEWVSRYQYDGQEIKLLLLVMFEHVSNIAKAEGEEAGKLSERATNPALREFGRAIADVVKTNRTAARTTMRATFDALIQSGTSNPYHAFEQALKALE